MEFQTQQHIAGVFAQFAVKFGKYQLRAAPGLADGNQVADFFCFLGKKSQCIFGRIFLFKSMDYTVKKHDIVVFLKLLVNKFASSWQ